MEWRETGCGNVTHTRLAGETSEGKSSDAQDNNTGGRIDATMTTSTICLAMAGAAVVEERRPNQVVEDRSGEAF